MTDTPKKEVRARDDHRRGTLNIENLRYWIQRRRSEGLTLPHGKPMTQDSIAVALGLSTTDALLKILQGKARPYAVDINFLAYLLKVKPEDIAVFTEPTDSEVIEYLEENEKKFRPKIEKKALMNRWRLQGLSKEQIEWELKQRGLDNL